MQSGATIRPTVPKEAGAETMEAQAAQPPAVSVVGPFQARPIREALARQPASPCLGPAARLRPLAVRRAQPLPPLAGAFRTWR